MERRGGEEKRDEKEMSSRGTVQTRDDASRTRLRERACAACERCRLKYRAQELICEGESVRGVRAMQAEIQGARTNL